MTFLSFFLNSRYGNISSLILRKSFNSSNLPRTKFHSLPPHFLSLYLSISPEFPDDRFLSSVLCRRINLFPREALPRRPSIMHEIESRINCAARRRACTPRLRRARPRSVPSVTRRFVSRAIPCLFARAEPRFSHSLSFYPSDSSRPRVYSTAHLAIGCAMEARLGLGLSV